VRHFELQELSFIARAEETAKLRIEAKAELPLIEKKVEIARYTFAPITVMVGPVPVVFVPVLTVNVGIDGSVYVGLRSEVTQEAVLKAGLRYADETWRAVKDFSNQFDYSDPPTLQPTAGVEAKAYAGTQLALKLYGVAGPYAEVDAYLELDVDSAKSPWWTLYGGLEVPVGVKIEVLSREIANKEIVAIGYRLVLAHAQANNPPDLPFGPYPVDHAVNQSTEVNLSWSGIDPDGDNLTYDVYFEAWDATPEVRVSENQAGLMYDPGTLSADMRCYWQVVARDEHGATKAGPVWEFVTGSGTGNRVIVTDIYTADYWVQPQNVFRPGEFIFLVIEATNLFDQPVDVLYHWSAYDPAGDPVPEFVFSDWPSTIPAGGREVWLLPRGAPRDHPQGIYEFVGTVTHGTDSDSATATFTVMGDPVPMNLLKALTCKDVDEWTWPIDVTSDFTTADDNVFAWAEWEGGSGAHTVEWDWYRPDSTHHRSHSHSFDTNYELIRVWDSLPIYELQDHLGQWEVEISIDGLYATTLNFNLASAVLSSGAAESDSSSSGTAAPHNGVAPVPSPVHLQPER